MLAVVKINKLYCYFINNVIFLTIKKTLLPLSNTFGVGGFLTQIISQIQFLPNINYTFPG